MAETRRYTNVYQRFCHGCNNEVQCTGIYSGFSLRILVIVIGYGLLAGEFRVVNGEFSDL